MKKIILIGLTLVLLLGVSVIAQTLPTEKITTELVKNVAKEKGISEESIGQIEEVDFENLPKEVNLKNIDTTNLELYKLNITNETNPLYIITASSEFFTKSVKEYAKGMFLVFGFEGRLTNTTFLKTATGVTTSLEKGYVMTREGAISAISTNMEIIEKHSEDSIEINIYKNSERIGFRNEFYQNTLGVYNDYDQIDSNLLQFQKGDVISIEINLPEKTIVGDITTLLEIETN